MIYIYKYKYRHGKMNLYHEIYCDFTSHETRLLLYAKER